MLALKGRDRVLRALRREAVDRTPLWLMRQAGRYLPEYQELRRQAGSFTALCRNPDWAIEVSLQPLRRFPLDAAIVFSDILVVADAMGLGLSFVAGEGPHFAEPLRSERQIKALPKPDPEQELRYVMDSLRGLRTELSDGRAALIGFAAAPWTLAAYMVEGRGGTAFPLACALLQEQPALAHRLLSHLASSLGLYMQAQIAAGAEAVMIFETWAPLLDDQQFDDFSCPYLTAVVADIKAFAPQIPVIVFSRRSDRFLDALADTGCDALSLDWSIDLSEARRRVGDRLALQGNLNPALLKGSAAAMERAAKDVLESFGRGSGHVFNLGHGIQPDTDPAMVATLAAWLHRHSPAFHSDVCADS